MNETEEQLLAGVLEEDERLFYDIVFNQPRRFNKFRFYCKLILADWLEEQGRVEEAEAWWWIEECHVAPCELVADGANGLWVGKYCWHDQGWATSPPVPEILGECRGHVVVKQVIVELQCKDRMGFGFPGPLDFCRYETAGEAYADLIQALLKTGIHHASKEESLAYEHGKPAPLQRYRQADVHQAEARPQGHR